MQQAQGIVLFDGVCNLCNGAVNFIIQRDAQQRFLFAPLQSPYAQRLLAEQGMHDLGLESFVLIDAGRLYLRTNAALRIAPKLGSGWFLCSIFRLLPAGFRDCFYRLVARHRYAWFGKQAQCLMPSPELAARFRWD